MNYPMNYDGAFASIYNKLLNGIQLFPANIKCNSNDMLYEMLNVTLTIHIAKSGDIPLINLYSSSDTKAIPIGFVLAEFLTILTKDPDISHLAKFNNNILNYTENGLNSPHYGTRLYDQLPKLLILLIKDQHTRQACANIWTSTELELKHKSCNVFIQFIIRDNQLNLIVISRSSDLLTGLIIDSIHWQMLLISFYWELKWTYNDLDIGSVVYKISSLHVYATDNEIMQDLPTLIIPFTYSYYLPFTKTFSWLRDAAPAVKHCNGINDLCELYLFNDKQIDVIQRLRDIYKARKFNVKR